MVVLASSVLWHASNTGHLSRSPQSRDSSCIEMTNLAIFDIVERRRVERVGNDANQLMRCLTRQYCVAVESNHIFNAVQLRLRGTYRDAEGVFFTLKPAIQGMDLTALAFIPHPDALRNIMGAVTV